MAAVQKKNSPFKATRMWNQLLNSFQEGMELKRKRWRLKSYENCFSGAEALDWLHNYIQNHPSFGQHITREQAFMLLQKFLENNVFETAVKKTCKKFQDTNVLYKFSETLNYDTAEQQSDCKENLPSQNSLSNLLKNFRRNSRNLSSDLEKTPKGKIADVKNPPVKHLGMKQSRISKTGVTPLAFDLNNISLMPTTKQEGYSDMSTILCDPENDDVFNTSVSQNFFMRSNSLRINKTTMQQNGKFNFNSFLENQGEGDILYSNVLNQTISKQPILKSSKKKNTLRKIGVTTKLSPKGSKLQTIRKRRSEEKLCCNSPSKKSKESTKDTLKILPKKALLLLGENASFIKEVESYTTQEVHNLPGYKPKYQQKLKSASATAIETTTATVKKQALKQNKSNIENVASNQNNSPKVKKQRKKISTRTHSMKRRSLSQNNLNLKQFSQSIYNLNQDFFPKRKEHSSNQDIYNGLLYKAPSTWTINTIGLDHNSDHNKTYDLTTIDIEDTWKSVVLLSLKKLLCKEEITTFLNTHEIHGESIMKNVNWKTTEITDDAPDWLLSAMKCLSNWPVRIGNIDDSVLQDVSNYPGFERDVYRAIKEHYHSTLNDSLIPSHMYPLLEECSEILNKMVEKSIRLFQHVILLLPCWNCRQLQLLLKFMKTLAGNEKLQITHDLLNKDLVVHSFFSLILRQDKFSMTSAKKEDTVAIRITIFLMEHYEEVFKPPSNIRFQVDHKLAVTIGAPSFSTIREKKYSSQYLTRPSSAGDKPKSLKKQTSYCVQISREEYANEAKEMSDKAIRELLANVAQDSKLSEKDKKKRMKQFQKAYPEIYAEQYPRDDVSNCSTISTRSSSTKFKHALKPSFLVEKIL